MSAVHSFLQDFNSFRVSQSYKLFMDNRFKSLNQVLAAKTMTEMKQVFASLKEQDRISYGVYAPETVAEQCYLLFYTRTGEVKGVLKKNDKELNDVRTKEATDIAVFSGCGAYWFILK